MTDVRIRYESALAKLMDQVKEDRHILAAILGGSLAHDQVWERPLRSAALSQHISPAALLLSP
jgi:hypothetical protein